MMMYLPFSYACLHELFQIQVAPLYSCIINMAKVLKQNIESKDLPLVAASAESVKPFAALYVYESAIYGLLF